MYHMLELGIRDKEQVEEGGESGARNCRCRKGRLAHSGCQLSEKLSTSSFSFFFSDKKDPVKYK